MSSKKTNYTASEARAELYSLLRDASMGIAHYEITNKYGEAAILMSKEEFESWQETLDIMSNPEEYRAIMESKKSKKTYTFEEVLKELGITEEELATE